jgi:hypothetical protein
VLKSMGVLALSLTVALGGCGAGRNAASVTSATAPLVPEVRVDERIELLAIIFRLAGAEEYNKRFVPAYATAIDRYFEGFKQHPAVLAVNELRARDSVSYNAIPDLAVQLGPLPELRERVPLETAQLDPRWKPDAARAFLVKARAFAADTNFAAFFASQRPIYDAAERRMRNLIANEANLRWVQQFYGGSGEERFIVAPAPGNGQVAYGVRYFGADGAHEFYSVINVMNVDEDGLPHFPVGNASLLVHEFGHSYVTPLILDNYADLRPTGELLLETFRAEMTPQGYAEGSTIIHESIIRAGVARYKRAHVGEDAARRELDRQRLLGFLWIDELYDLLGTYEQNRARYPSLPSFYPVLRDYFTQLRGRLPAMVAAYEQRRPKIVEALPANGSEGVDPALTRIIVRFDRPMREAWGWAPFREGMGAWPNISGVAFDDSRTTLTATVRLEPNTAYEASFLPAQFVSADGVPIARYSLKFTTGTRRPAR